MRETYPINRTEIIAAAALSLGVEMPGVEVLQRTEDAARESHERYGLVPTIGCEIEVKWSSHFPELAQLYFGQSDAAGRFERRFSDLTPEQQAELNQSSAPLHTTLQERYEMTRAAGIPKGNDAYWEFANAPVYSWKTLAAEVDMLYRAGLIPGSQEHSLHITLGGIEAGAGGMALVLAGVELLHVSPQRILCATYDNQFGTHSAWARRGRDGMRERYASMLSLGQSRGVEFRTLGVSSPQQAADIFQTAQTLTTVLTAFRARHGDYMPATQDLASLWPLYRSQLKQLWSLRGLPAESWGSPNRNSMPWQVWAHSLELREDSETPEHRTVSRIRALGQKALSVIGRLA